MNIKCPHCETEYEIDKSEYGRFVKCETCGKGFVAGTSVAKKLGTEAMAVSNAVKLPVPQPMRGLKNQLGRAKCDVSLRQINIYGYREWFVGAQNRPVTVLLNGVVHEIPYKGCVTITSKVNEHIVFKWIDHQGVVKETEAVIGDVKNIVLSLNRKDWSLHATKTNNPEKLVGSKDSANTRFLTTCAIIAMLAVAFVLWGLNEKWHWFDKAGDWFDTTPADVLGRAHEPYELRSRSSGQKMIDEAYKNQCGLDFTSYWYVKCPSCGTKLSTPDRDGNAKKVKCINCGHKWKCK